MRRLPTLILVFALVFGCFLAADIKFDLASIEATGATLYVGGSGGGNYSVIQMAINDANPGDTVYVFTGMYSEGLLIDKTLNLVGESRYTCVINASEKTYGINVKDTAYVNITGFTVKGSTGVNIKITSSNHTHVFDNILSGSGNQAVAISPGSFNLIENNHIKDNREGIDISGTTSSGNLVRLNIIESCNHRAISLQSYSHDNLITENTISGYNIGIYIYDSEGNRIQECEIFQGNEGLRIANVDDIIIRDCTISANDIGLWAFDSTKVAIFNSSFENSNTNDIRLGDATDGNADVTLYNTSFDYDKIKVVDAASSLAVYWFIKTLLVDEGSVPIAGASVEVTGNQNSTYSEIFTSNSQGRVETITLMESYENSTSRIFTSPYKFVATKGNLTGSYETETLLEESTDITIILYVDSDGDGVPDALDDFPSDPTQWQDGDGDGYGDNPLGNQPDEFPFDPLEWSDSDSDGVGDNADAFPQDPLEQTDSDSDGVGDNSDAFPTNPREWKDSDGDGVGDNSDDFPNNPDEWDDSDSDGIGDNSDILPDFNNTLFFIILGIVIVVCVLALLMAVKKRKRKDLPFDGKESE